VAPPEQYAWKVYVWGWYVNIFTFYKIEEKFYRGGWWLLVILIFTGSPFCPGFVVMCLSMIAPVFFFKLYLLHLFFSYVIPVFYRIVYKVCLGVVFISGKKFPIFSVVLNINLLTFDVIFRYYGLCYV